MLKALFRWLGRAPAEDETSEHKAQATLEKKTRQEMKERQSNTRQYLKHLRMLGRHAALEGQRPKLKNPQARQHILDALEFVRKFDGRTGTTIGIQYAHAYESRDLLKAALGTLRLSGHGNADIAESANKTFETLLATFYPVARAHPEEAQKRGIEHWGIRRR